jgi:glycerol uptake facilitator-like aquaporin
MFLGFLTEATFFGLFTFAIFQLGKWRQKWNKKSSELYRHTMASFLVSLFLIVIVTAQIPLTGASCNPFRSLAPLIFESWGQNGAIGWVQYPLYMLSIIVGAQIGMLCSTNLLKQKQVKPLV